MPFCLLLICYLTSSNSKLYGMIAYTHKVDTEQPLRLKVSKLGVVYVLLAKQHVLITQLFIDRSDTRRIQINDADLVDYSTFFKFLSALAITIPIISGIILAFNEYGFGLKYWRH